MLPLLLLILLILCLTSQEHQVKAQYTPPYSSYVFPVHKHTDGPFQKPLFSLQINDAYVNMQFLSSNYLLHIDAPFGWRHCIVQWNMYPGSCPDNTTCTSPVACDEYQCTDIRASYSPNSPYCRRVTNVTIDNGAFCVCPVNVLNPIISGDCTQPLLNYDEFFVTTCNGRNPTPEFMPVTINGACAPTSSLGSFPPNIVGVVSFSNSPYAVLPTLETLTLRRAFSVCLPSTVVSSGTLFYGNGPYYFHRPGQLDVDVTSFLSYTPLLKNPGSFGYFIGVNAIVIKKRSIQIPSDATTKISTTDPYTTLRSDIYKQVLRRVSMVTKRIPSANPIEPFGLCFSTFNNGSKVDIKVPVIGLSLTGGRTWGISTPNSIKQVTDDVACLAFVDGGSTSEHAIVIGTFQFEDNLVMFDLENSTFGFSSSLLPKQTSCSNFNFTSVSS